MMTVRTVQLAAIALAAIAVLTLATACGTEIIPEPSTPNDSPGVVAAAPSDSDGDKIVDDASNTDQDTPPTAPAPPAAPTGPAANIGSTIVEAEVVSLEMQISESDQYPYIVRVAILVSTICQGYETQQSSFDSVNGATDIYVAVYNRVISSDLIDCYQAKSTPNIPVRIGTDFEEGVTYTVHAGELTTTFVGRGSANVHPILFSNGPTGEKLGVAVRPLFGEEGGKYDFNGTDIYIYEYETIADGIKAEMEAMILSSWPGPPTIIRRGSSVVVVMGHEQTDISLLHELLWTGYGDSHFGSDASEPEGPYSLPLVADPELAETYTLELEYKGNAGNVTLFATIVGGPDSDKKFHCAQEEWFLGDGTRKVRVFDCSPWEEGIKFARTYEMEHLYDEAGLYEVTFRKGPLVSNTVTVRIEASTRTFLPFSPERSAAQPDGTHIQVGGPLFIGADGVPVLCSGMLESYPPQCVSPLKVENLPNSFYEDLKSASGIRWSSRSVTISGVISNGVLFADD